jgi:hypothetical protein
MHIFIEQYRSLFVWLFDSEILEKFVGGFLFWVVALAMIFFRTSRKSKKNES